MQYGAETERVANDDAHRGARIRRDHGSDCLALWTSAVTICCVGMLPLRRLRRPSLLALHSFWRLLLMLATVVARLRGSNNRSCFRSGTFASCSSFPPPNKPIKVHNVVGAPTWMANGVKIQILKGHQNDLNGKDERRLTMLLTIVF
jgi:hypothetical protein